MHTRLVPFHAVFLFLSLTLCDFAKAQDRSLADQGPTELTENDQRILENGEIRGFRRAAGIVLAVGPGFGIGQAVQGRYAHSGWIFTLGDLGSAALLYQGFSHSSSDSMNAAFITLGFTGFITFRVLEIIDSISGPIRDNWQFRSLQPQLSLEPGIMDEAGQHAPRVSFGLNWNLR